MISAVYRIEEEEVGNEESWWKYLWRSRIYERSKFFLWKLANRGLLVVSNLISRGVEIECDICVHGCESAESKVHLFFHCEVAKRMWFIRTWCTRWENLDCIELPSFLKCLMEPTGVLLVHLEDKDEFFLFSTIILEYLWWLRNRIMHIDPVESANLSLPMVFSRYKEFIEVKDSQKSEELD